LKYQTNLNGIKSSPPNDVFFTPEPLAIELIAAVDIEPSDSILDPFKGEGAFFGNFPPCAFKDWAEITEGRDFFSESRRFDWLISNPPFSLMSKVLLKTCALSIKGFAYIIPAHSLSYRRIKECESFGFYLSKTIYFQNPSAWGMGFQMMFAIFTKAKPENIYCTGEASPLVQSMLEVFD